MPHGEPSNAKKRVRFGTTTIIPIPRRGKLTLSSCALEDPTTSPLDTPKPIGAVSPAWIPLEAQPQAPLHFLESASPLLFESSDSGGSLPLFASASEATEDPSLRNSTAPSTLGLPAVYTISSETLSTEETELIVDTPMEPLRPSTAEAQHLDDLLDHLVDTFAQHPRTEGMDRSPGPQQTLCTVMATDTQLSDALDQVLGCTPLSQCRPVHSTVAAIGSSQKSDSAGRVPRTPIADHCVSEMMIPPEVGRLHHATARRLEVCDETLEERGKPAATIDKVTSASQQRVCVFCQRAEDPIDNGADFIEAEGLHCHTACALWCPEVYYDASSGVLCNIPAALQRSALIKCAYCRKTGAAVGCVCVACQLSYHMPCASQAKSRLDVKTFQMWCPIHATGDGKAPS